MTRFALPTLFLSAALLAGGCNLLEPFYDDDGTVATLVEDARHARASGDFNRAVTLLERALDKERSNPTVRLELASTLMQREGLTFLHLERLTNHLLGALGQAPAAGRAAAGEASGNVCTFGDDVHTEPFDPRDFDGFEALIDAQPTLQYVIELLNDPDAPTEAPAMPNDFTSLDVCTVVASGRLDYDREGVLAAIRARFDNDEYVTAALTTNAVALTLASYAELFEQPDLPVDWFVVDGTDVGACVAESQYDLFVKRAQGQVERFGKAVLALDLLMLHSGNAQYAAYVDDALELYASIETDEMNPCNG